MKAQKYNSRGSPGSAAVRVTVRSVSQPLFGVGSAHALDGLFGIGGFFAAVAVDKELAVGGLEEALFITGSIAEIADSLLLDEFGGISIVLNLADDLLHVFCTLTLFARQRGFAP